jgi:DNA-binding NarL/FixJ family response regulator
MGQNLTSREQQALEAIAYGATNREVAGRLGVTEKTVKNTLRSVFQKMDVRNRTEAVLTFHNIEWRGK